MENVNNERILKEQQKAPTQIVEKLEYEKKEEKTDNKNLWKEQINELMRKNKKNLEEWKDAEIPERNEEKEQQKKREESNNLNETEKENPNKIVFKEEEEKLTEKEQNNNLNEDLKKENLNTISTKKDYERLEKIKKKLEYVDYLFSSFMSKLLTVVKYKYYEDDILAAKYIKDYKITLNSDSLQLSKIYGNRRLPKKDRIYATFYDLYIAFKKARMNYRNYLNTVEDLDSLEEPKELERKSLNYLSDELKGFIKNFAIHNIYDSGNNFLEDFIVNNEFFNIDFYLSCPPSIITEEPIKFKYDCFKVIENVYKNQTHGHNENNETINNTTNLNEIEKLFKENLEIFNFIYKFNLDLIEGKIPIKTPSSNPLILKNKSYKEKKFLNLKNLFLRLFKHCRDNCIKNLKEEKFKNKLDVTYNFLKEENKNLRKIYDLILECSPNFKKDFNNINNEEKELISKNFIETFFKVFDGIENKIINADKIAKMAKKSKSRNYEKEKPKDEDLQFLVEPEEFGWGKTTYAKHYGRFSHIDDNLFNEVFERITTLVSDSELSEDTIVYKLLNNLNDSINFYANSEIDY